MGPGEAVEIMTGAPVPAGADAVVMVEHAERAEGACASSGAPSRGQFINPQALAKRAPARWCCAPAPGWITAAWPCWPHPGGRRVRGFPYAATAAIVATGDEIVAVAETPSDFQIRNSNALLAGRAGGARRRRAVDSAGGARQPDSTRQD